jgi:hypothetical protein
MAPFVSAKFSDGAVEITVGNKSAPQRGNDAIIKSFEYGYTDGLELKFEIVDEQGSIFNDFVNGLVKCAKTSTEPSVNVKVDFGWVLTDCKGGGHTVIQTTSPIVAFPTHLEINYAEGKIRYNITCKDPMNALYATREDCVEGDDEQKMRLEDAIRELCNKDPKLEVEFVRIEKDGTRKPNKISWEEGEDEGGPEARWPAMSHDRLTTIRSWINKQPVKEGDPGVRIHMNPIDPSGRKISIVQSLDEGRRCTPFGPSLGTFIVNGGSCSNVLDFTPKMNWAGGFGAFGAGGGSGSAMTGKNSYKEKGGKPDVEKNHDNEDSCMSGGPQESIVPDQTSQDIYGEDAVEATNKAERQHAEANALYEQFHPIEAEMRIVGNPRDLYVNPTFKGSLTCSIIAINPFHIKGGGLCGDWNLLSRSGCNEILTNRGWQVIGVNHSIKEGSYVTTLKLKLPTPGITIDDNKRLGDDPLSLAGKLRNLCEG